MPVNDTLNVQAAASTTSDDIGDFQNGAFVELLETQDGWARIIGGEGSGISSSNRHAYYFQAPDMAGVLRPKTCSEGMSDRIYGWEIDAVTGQGILSGKLPRPRLQSRLIHRGVFRCR